MLGLSSYLLIYTVGNMSLPFSESAHKSQRMAVPQQARLGICIVASSRPPTADRVH